MYLDILARLTEKIGLSNYFSDSIHFSVSDLDCRLTAAIIVYRNDISYPEGTNDEITDLIPVWWEFHTMKNGNELPNNFQFSTLKKYL